MDELEARKGELARKVEKAKNALRFSIPKHIGQGLESVARVVEEEGIRGWVLAWGLAWVGGDDQMRATPPGYTSPIVSFL